MIFFGSKARQREIGSGAFDCPNCQAHREYKQMQSSVFFTLYFIPLFKIRSLGDFVECKTCAQSFQMDVLNYELPSDEELVVQQVQVGLEAGLPVHMMEKKLANNGMAAEDISLVLEQASRGLLKSCMDCSFSYISTVTECANCGGKLELV